MRVVRSVHCPLLSYNIHLFPLLNFYSYIYKNYKLEFLVLHCKRCNRINIFRNYKFAYASCAYVSTTVRITKYNVSLLSIAVYTIYSFELENCLKQYKIFWICNILILNIDYNIDFLASSLDYSVNTLIYRLLQIEPVRFWAINVEINLCILMTMLIEHNHRMTHFRQ